jgi:hypothetical protein
MIHAGLEYAYAIAILMTGDDLATIGKLRWKNEIALKEASVLNRSYITVKFEECTCRRAL